MYRIGRTNISTDSVQRNCFELALYTTRDHDCISNRIGSGIRNSPRCRYRLATFAALPTPSMIERAIIMMTDHRFGDMLLAPHRQVRRSHRSIHCWHGRVARRSALPRERFRSYGLRGEAMAPSSRQQSDGVPHGEAERPEQMPCHT